MTVTQTIKLSDEERLAIQEVLGLCDEIAHISHTSMTDVFSYLSEISDVIGNYQYLTPETLQISEIG